jgi:hypothetical protein
MAKKIPQKTSSFGTVAVNHLTPASFEENAPDAINIKISFEEALKLYFGIGQCLAKLNSYNRATTAGRKAGMNLCLFVNKSPKVSRLTVNEDTIREA